jgi:hypothetical protein
MRTLLAVAIFALCINSSCRYTTCREPGVSVNFQYPQSVKHEYILYKFPKHGELINPISTTITHGSTWLSSDYDWTVQIIGSDKIHSIQNIHYTGSKKGYADGLYSEIKTKCYRDTRYSFDGKNYTVRSADYEKNSHQIQIVISD